MSSSGNTVDGRRHATARRPVTSIVAWSLFALWLAVTGAGGLLMEQVWTEHAPHVGIMAVIAEPAALSAVFAPFAIVGAVVVSRRPRQPIGWILLAAAVAIALFWVGASYSLLAIGAAPAEPPVIGLVAAWIAPTTSIFGLGLAMGVIPLVYPNGRLPSPRWRAVLWGLVVLAGIHLAMNLFRERLTGELHLAGAPSVVVYDVPNPLAGPWSTWAETSTVENLTGIALAALLVLAAVSVAVRYRRAYGVERAQLQWLAFAAGVIGAIVIAMIVAGVVGEGWPPGALWSALYVSVAGYPVAIGVAVLRYRLYEIDRIISRTVTYGLVVAVLGAVYVTGVVGLGAVVSGFAGEQGGDLVVAASVLAVVALFRPVTSRVQRAVDRRFNRSGYEARLAVVVFSHQVRDEVDLEAITRSVAETAAVAVQPEHVSLWLADARGQR